MLDVVAALIPPAGVGLLFWFVMRLIVSADRRERAALAELDRAESARADGSPQAAPGTRNDPVI